MNILFLDIDNLCLVGLWAGDRDASQSGASARMWQPEMPYA